jgi:hypothetical protein
METIVNPAEAGNNAPQGELAAAIATPPETAETPATPELNPSEPPQEHDWKKRFEGTSQAHKQLSEEHQQVIDTNVKLVEKNPDLLEHLAESNPKLADQVSKKLHGKDYSTYLKDIELENLKGSDPEKYEQEQRLRKVEQREKERIETDRKEFLKSKGIKDNEFDPAYQKVKAELEALNPQFVEDNPVEAWEKAYRLAFPGGNAQTQQSAAALAANTNKTGGLSAMLSQRPSKLSPEQQAFKDKMSGAK